MTDAAQTPPTAQPLVSAPMMPQASAPAVSSAPLVQPPTSTPTPTPNPTPIADISDQEKVAMFEQVLDEVTSESSGSPDSLSPVQQVFTPGQPGAAITPPIDPGVLSQAVPMAVNQAASSLLLNPSVGTTTAKESQKLVSHEQPKSDITMESGGVQTVEQERTPEIPPEVEAYLQNVEDHQEQAPKEVVIADGSVPSGAPTYPSKPVVVLPITEKIEQLGMKKSPLFSIRWLVEWSHKIIKMFVGKVVYREAEENS